MTQNWEDGNACKRTGSCGETKTVAEQFSANILLLAYNNVQAQVVKSQIKLLDDSKAPCKLAALESLLFENTNAFSLPGF